MGIASLHPSFELTGSQAGALSLICKVKPESACLGALAMPSVSILELLLCVNLKYDRFRKQRSSQMDYHEFTNATLSMMYFGARGALAADDELGKLGQVARFRVRETQSWKRHIADLEAEMIRRGMTFEVIDLGPDVDRADSLC